MNVLKTTIFTLMINENVQQELLENKSIFVVYYRVSGNIKTQYITALCAIEQF